MQKKSVTRNALISSIIIMVMCCTMFMGTTYAWFTDSVSSANNLIEAGNLDVDLQLFDEDIREYKSIANEEGAIFREDGNGINWEPGKTEIVYLRVKNNGSLNLKFKFILSVVDGGLIGSLEYAVLYDVQAGTTYATWEEMKTAATENYVRPLQAGAVPIFESATLAPRDSGEASFKYVALAVHMDEEADNKYQGKNVMIDASVFATQAAVESDSFNSDYDAQATYDYKECGDSTTFMTLWEDSKEGSTIYLTNDITISGLLVKKNMTIDAGGHNFSVIQEAQTVSSETQRGITLTEGKTLIIRNAKMQTLPVTGIGTIILSGSTITASTEGVSAVSLNNANLNLIVKGYTVLTGAKNGDGIYVGAGSTLDLSGTGKLVSKGNGGVESEYTASTADGGSGIGGEGTIKIHDMANLTAEGYGTAGFGIGGNVSSISVTNTNIAYVKGGYVQADMLIDNKYGKGEPEGGSAIGSMLNGSVISLDGVTIEKAEGGSKSAGIGARYHTSVTVNISNSTIKSVTGGNSSAGIGGSRIGNDNSAEQDVTINISNSTITAQGGRYGAGIGSGYDTYCHTPELSPMCTIRITGNSVINATGGTYAAGIGTGYHAGGLDGEIESTVSVNAVSGEKFYKDAYTKAQDIGFGVIDPTRDGLNNTCTIKYNGMEIGVPEV